MEFLKKAHGWLSLGMSLVAINGMIFGAFVRIDRLENKTAILDHLPERITTLEERQALVWKLYVEDALCRALKNEKIKNPTLKVEQKVAEEFVADTLFVRILKKVVGNDSLKTNHEIAEGVIHEMGIEFLCLKAKSKKLTVGEYIAVFVAAVVESRRIGIDKFLNGKGKLSSTGKCTNGNGD